MKQVFLLRLQEQEHDHSCDLALPTQLPVNYTITMGGKDSRAQIRGIFVSASGVKTISFTESEKDHWRFPFGGENGWRKIKLQSAQDQCPFIQMQTKTRSMICYASTAQFHPKKSYLAQQWFPSSSLLQPGSNFHSKYTFHTPVQNRYLVDVSRCCQSLCVFWRCF